MNKLFEFPIEAADLSKAGMASSFIKKILKELNCSRDVIRRVAIATYEAEINVVIHSHGGMCRFIIEDDTLKVTYFDCGPGIHSIEYAMLEGTSTAPKYAIESGFGAGMGLPNMKKAADDFHITSSHEGTIIKMLFNLKGEIHENK